MIISEIEEPGLEHIQASCSASIWLCNESIIVEAASCLCRSFRWLGLRVEGPVGAVSAFSPLITYRLSISFLPIYVTPGIAFKTAPAWLNTYCSIFRSD